MLLSPAAPAVLLHVVPRRASAKIDAANTEMPYKSHRSCPARAGSLTRRVVSLEGRPWEDAAMPTQEVSVSRVVEASPAEVFAVLSSPAGHARIDGSGSVRAAIEGPEPLALGDKFRMDMKLGLPYKMWSTVVEFEQDRLIAWAHFGKHRWRFELEPVGEGTMVTQTFDWSTARIPKFIELMGYPEKHPANMEATLAALAAEVAA